MISEQLKHGCDFWDAQEIQIDSGSEQLVITPQWFQGNSRREIGTANTQKQRPDDWDSPW